MAKIGFTTTIPVEIILAANKVPLDLNNIFVNAPDAQRMLDFAEEAGYPRTTCGWIKGLYTAALEHDLEALIAVMQGDCSNTEALMETLQIKGVNTIPFAFPFDRDIEMLKIHMGKLLDIFEVSIEKVHEKQKELVPMRNLLQELDRMTWEDNLVTSSENHYFLVSSSDFNSNPHQFKQDLTSFLEIAKTREPFKDEIRLAYIGVPPIFTNLYEVLESLGARVVFNEVQRQFSMPYNLDNIYDQYIAYTYPYGIFARLEDIEHEIRQRNIDGVIHYTQSFCYRQIEDLIIRERLDIPFITLEGDKPGKVDARSRMRLEAFVNMIKY
ncbi:MAG TPA: 2-hydroxyacyl-CoA dehydratase [Syntrophomonadaceae bacterium]|nr:2-hydroxyacyl-CoA dehydratase [Syntrophomonadaceae bacterium]